MSIIEEHYIQINLWGRPLAKTRYSFSDMRKVRLHPRSDGTSTLLAAMREKERREDEASKTLHRGQAEHDRAHDEYTNALSEFSPVYAGFDKNEIAEAITTDEDAAALEGAAEKPHRLKRIKSRVATALFDYSEIEQEKIEDEINALVNADGYYDEVEPVDANEDYGGEKSINTTVLLLSGVLVLFLLASALYFHFIF